VHRKSQRGSHRAQRGHRTTWAQGTNAESARAGASTITRRRAAIDAMSFFAIIGYTDTNKKNQLIARHGFGGVLGGGLAFAAAGAYWQWGPFASQQQLRDIDRVSAGNFFAMADVRQFAASARRACQSRIIMRARALELVASRLDGDDPTAQADLSELAVYFFVGERR
jgi:hypothetical protein